MRQPKHNKEQYLNFELPNDDMDVGIRNRSSKLTKTRKETKCCYCGTKINNGDYSLSERGFLDDAPFYVHYCLDCVEESMAYEDDNYEKWLQRAKASGFVK